MYRGHGSSYEAVLMTPKNAAPVAASGTLWSALKIQEGVKDIESDFR